MRTKTYTCKGLWSIFLISGVLFSSCIKNEGYGDPRQGEAAVIELNVSSESAIAEADQADNDMNSLRVLIYDSRSGFLAFNIAVPTIPTPDEPARLDILTGTYDFVFIANEDSDQALKGMFTQSDADINHIDKLRMLSFARTAFDAGKAIPMVTLVERVSVFPNSIEIPNTGGPVTGIWDVDMQRVAVRLRMTFTMTESLFERWATPKAITIGNIAGGAYVLPSIDNSTQQSGTGIFAAALTDTLPGLISAVDDEGNVTVVYDRLIMPELFLSQANNTVDNAMVMSMDFGDKIKSATIKATDGSELGYGLPRNTFLDMQVNVTEYYIMIDAEIVAWGDAGMDNPFDGQFSFEVEQSEYFFSSHGGTQSIAITTDHPDGWTLEDIGAAWVTLPTAADNTLTVPEYSGTTPRKGTFTIVAGNIHKTIHVTQFPPAPSVIDQSITDSYVGAFWKANQFGERLIRTPPVDAGKWAATVIEGEEWIHLDTVMTSDPNVGWLAGANETAVADGNDPGFDNTYSVGGNLKSVNGRVASANNGIYFRIGLNSQYTPTEDAPARYGVVLLSYNDNTKIQRIWIRQGEEADYLFSNDDPVSTPALTQRTATVPFSAYNLTAPAGRINTELGVRGGIFTEYPSQAGALFTWGSTTAWAAVGTATGFSMPNVTGLWSTLGATVESCPPGYHRPNDGPTATITDASSVTESEARQSLWLTPPADKAAPSVSNFTSGYYADGYFDRRNITSNTVSGTDQYAVAYKGHLHFNPATFASLFMPYAGHRTSSSAVGNNGSQLMAWTSSRNNSSSNVTGWFISSGQTNTLYSYMNNISFTCNSIRCVKDVE